MLGIVGISLSLSTNIYIYIHTYIHYMTWRYVTLHYIIIHYIYTRCVCGSAGKKLPKHEWKSETEKLSSHGALPKRAPSSRSSCHATIAFLVSELGPQIWSLKCLPQRARSCFCDQNWLHFQIFGPQKHVCESGILNTAGGGNMARYYRSKGCTNGPMHNVEVCLEDLKPCYCMVTYYKYKYIDKYIHR